MSPTIMTTLSALYTARPRALSVIAGAEWGAQGSMTCGITFPAPAPAPAPRATFPLPNELIIDILEYAVVHPTHLAHLALISKRTTELFNTILYRTVLLPTARAILHFARTATSAAPGLLHQHVKRVVLAELHAPPSVHDAVRAILRTCTGAHTFVLPGAFVSDLLKPDNFPAAPSHGAVPTPAPTHLTIGYFDDPDASRRWSAFLPPTTTHTAPLPPLCIPRAAPALLAGLTHLRLGEPAELFLAPRALLAHLGALPRLTHLHVARQIDANEDNDVAFVQDVAQLLRARPALACVVVGAFLPLFGPARHRLASIFDDGHEGREGAGAAREKEKEKAEQGAERCRAATIWRLVGALQKTEERLLLVPGRYGSWWHEWQGAGCIANASEPVDFWRETVAEGLRERERGRLAEAVGEGKRV